MSTSNAPAEAAAGPSAVTALTLTRFRNYDYLQLEPGAAPVVLVGPNGAGKTNILEAISLLSPGKGMRKAGFLSIDRRPEGGMANGPWAVAATVHAGGETLQIGTARDAESEAERRIVKIDGKILRGQQELARLLTVLWLIPAMDGLFQGGASERRKFFDRMVYGFDAEHASRIAAYEHTLRERGRLLEQGRGDSSWLDALEHKLAEYSVSIAAARLEAFSRLQSAMAELAGSPFPTGALSLRGEAEQWLAEGKTALETETCLRDVLAMARGRDAATGRASAGAHRADLEVVYSARGIPAGEGSTGEQKAMLLSLVLAQTKALTYWTGRAPILLLDEVAAHLDETRRAALAETLLAFGMQAWLTGVDEGHFAALQGKARFLKVENGNAG